MMWGYLIRFGHTEELLLKKEHKTAKIPALDKLTHMETTCFKKGLPFLR